ncbi:hypothetical protein Cantr_02668 [Candida viswanathii]|uniref:Uncharacterized protein n=1 Tax=Candida viswanathii TaxID=5486 RepID=A0A367YMS2_9ASCO|nr:hypothetical protein Cantr_02668 [Candida viswanathii]
MSSEFLQSSSPTREGGDHDKKGTSSMTMPTQTPLHNKISSSAFPLTKSSSKSTQQQQQQQQFFNVTASASKYMNQPFNLLGWTPLISKTYTNEQILSFNSTPNKLLLQTSTSNNHNNTNNNNINPNTSTSGVNDLDFQGFGLTPFLNHNLNVLGSASSINQFNSLTPYHEKIFHNSNDFYIDSPIRFGNTSGNDIQAITPSKFSLNTVANKKILQDPMKSATKRSIALLDTPPRQPHKLSISTKAEKDEKEDPETDDENIGNVRRVQPDTDDEEGDDEEEGDFDKKALLQTPSKVLKDITNTNKPKIQFQTPAKQKIVAPSSPSTIILSSPTKGSSVKPKKKVIFSGKENEDDAGIGMMGAPPSPTPAKNMPVTPVMGVFSEKKPATKNEKNKPAALTNKSSSSNSQAKSTANKSKPKPKPKPKSKPQAGSSSSGAPDVNDSKQRAANKAKMQAGMNKFQIVLTDVHTLVNNKKKKPKDESRGLDSKKQPSKKSSNNQLHPPLQPSSSQPPQLAAQLSSLQDHNVTMNTSKEHSSIISGVNNTMNTSHLNMTTDHSSFELGGNYASTPNSKFLLDKIFEKTSPQTNYFIHQQQQQQQHMAQLSHQQHHMMHALQQAHAQLSQPQDGSMPPPLQTSSSKQQQQVQYLPQQMPMMSMTMSTPQHQGIVNYTPQLYNADGTATTTSPDALYAYGSTTPQGISIYPAHGQFSQTRHHHHPHSQYDDSIE